jgi:hypothetical protein
VFELVIHGIQISHAGESQRELRPQHVVPVWSSEHDNPLDLLPLRISPAPVPISRRTGRPHCGQAFKGLADMLLNLSKRCPQLSH